MRSRTYLFAVALIGSGASAAAQQPPGRLTVADAVALAREANPMLQAARLKADAAAERVPQAGAWPDPRVDFGLANRMPGSLSATDDPMTMNEIRLTQMVPWPGKLGLGKERAQRLATAERFDAAEAELMLLARVRSFYYQVAYMDRAIPIMESTRSLLREFVSVTTTMYAVGSAIQQDVLQAQVSVARMTEDLTLMRQERVAMAGRLNALLGRPATAPVGELELPDPVVALPTADSLFTLALDHRPILRAVRERAAAAQAGYRAARRELYPDIMVSLSYGQRPQFDDMASLMVGISLPLWSGARQLPMRREMRAMESMAEADAINRQSETFADLVEMRSRAIRSANLSRLYATSIVPQARTAVDAALAAYRVGRVDYMTVVDNQMTASKYQIEQVRLAAEYQGTVAEIEAVVGVAIGGAQ